MKDRLIILNPCLKLLLIILFIASVSVSSSQAQDTDYKFRHITTNEGLPHSNVTAIFQDSKGFMWFGTPDGLNKYDGYKFINYKSRSGDFKSIGNSYIKSIVEDKKGNLWICSIKGISYYDRTLDAFTNYAHNPKDKNSLLDGALHTVFLDKEGILWIGSYDGGLDRFDPKTKLFTHFKHLDYDDKSLSYNGIQDIYEDSKGNLWLATTGGGLDLLDRESMTFIHFKHDENNPKSISSNIVSGVREDKFGNLWVSTDHPFAAGLNLFNRETNTFTRFGHEEGNSNSLCYNNVTKLAEDQQGNLWIGTRNGGISVLNISSLSFTTLKEEPGNSNGLNNNSIHSLYTDKKGNVWIGTYSGGVNFLDNNSKKFSHFKSESNKPSLSSNKFLSVCPGSDGNVWIGTDGGGINLFDPANVNFEKVYKKDDGKTGLNDNFIVALYEDKEGTLWAGTVNGGVNKITKDGATKTYNSESKKANKISFNCITVIYEDRKGLFWIGTWGGGLNLMDRDKEEFEVFTSKVDNPKSISDNVIFAIYEDTKNNLWIGTERGGLNLFDRKRKTFKRFSHKADNPKSISHDLVNVIFEDSKGNLWIGTNGGLNLFNYETENFSVFSEADGLPNDAIQAILEDERGNLWLSSNKGICKFNPKSKETQSFFASDGLQGNDFKRRAALSLSDGRMIFGGNNGFNLFHPDSIHQNPNIPPVAVTNFKIFNRPVEEVDSTLLQVNINETKGLTLSYQHSVFSFEFAALNYTLPEKNQFAYKMEGFDKDWNYVGNMRTASYTNLNPGEYTFRVKASNNDGVWNETGTSLAVVITPPYWQTWWFKTLLALSVVGGALTFYKVRMNTIKEQKAELEKQVKERTLEVVSQKEELQAQAEVLIDTNSALQERQQEILLQREQIEAQHSILEITNTKVMDSISYANSIQKAILPSSEKVATALPEHFILYRPKDIVSGDFYWFSHLTAAEINGKADKNFSFIAVVDCTGHGVPGAFMSIIGNNLLNEIVNLKHILDPAQILEELDKGVMRSVEQTEGVNTAGMDVCLLKVEQETDGMKITFSGAKRPVFMVKNGEMAIETIEADRRSIGALKFDQPFTNQEIFVKKGTMFYLSSDGYTDQNNPDRKKLGTPKLKECILQAVNHPVKEQLKIFENTLDAHQQGAEQRDDITLIGIRV